MSKENEPGQGEAQQKVNSKFRKKLTALWKDDRKYKTRLLIAAAASFVCCFTFLFFGPVEIIVGSDSSVLFTVFEVTPIIAAVSAAGFLVLALLLSALKGKPFNYAVSAVFALTVCGYLQGNYLNGHLASLTGDAIAWQDETGPMIVNLLVWVLLFLIPYLILYFDKKIWRRVVLYGSGLLVIMQAVALITVYGQASSRKDALSSEGMFDYSKNSNTIVFLMDRLDYAFVEDLLERQPDFFDPMDGFTCYTNAISEFTNTIPGANYILTANDENLWQEPENKYLEDTWTSGGKNILADMSDAGYAIDIYSLYSNMFAPESSATQYVENVFTPDYTLDSVHIIKSMLSLSAYRYLPVAMKPFFWCYTGDVNEGFATNTPLYSLNQIRYSEGIDSISLTDDNYLKFYHFDGSHPPYYMKRDGTSDGSTTSVSEQTEGSFRILFHAFEKMKELGIYDSSTIIITADHGDVDVFTEPLQKAYRIGLFYKPAGAAGTPMAFSKAPVSLKNISPTIIKEAGLDYARYGTPLDEVGEEDQVLRKCHHKVLIDGKQYYSYVFEIDGDASDFGNWVNTETIPIKYPF